ncbi:hypothetical protein J0895_14620 [Phormidium pseudopriestleyi FRX01]|uniref:Myosin heavy chain n=1 Tax=Phormidium pseudopriestleyi FRX01 TaxID=1759528 RepID=A0ABS3FT76_9CYAN|nr:hypothetical protein [Phormidium pseudopriestleyi]MBO0350317.1 hypothetical protein [Phormidium pseudopriestleyi FRX01]
MSQTPVKDSKAQILAQFQQLLASRQETASKVATKEEEAEKEKNQELLAVASTYTIDTIVKGLADLQLDFGGVVTQLAEKLGTETAKLDELKRAIAIEADRLEELRKIRVVADALHILTQEHQEKLALLDNQAALQQETIETDQAQKRKAWQKEQEEFDSVVQGQDETVTKEREQEAADYEYERLRIQELETDEYEERKRQQERELKEIAREKQKNWTEREKYLTEHQAEFAANQQKIAGFEEELKQAYTKAKEEAIAEVKREAKVKSDLFEKEWEGTKQGYDLTLQSLNSNIERQTQQIADINAQLQAATRQAQDLAMRAFQTSSNVSASSK